MHRTPPFLLSRPTPCFFFFLSVQLISYTYEIKARFFLVSPSLFLFLFVFLFPSICTELFSFPSFPSPPVSFPPSSSLPSFYTSLLSLFLFFPFCSSPFSPSLSPSSLPLKFLPFLSPSPSLFPFLLFPSGFPPFLSLLSPLVCTPGTKNKTWPYVCFLPPTLETKARSSVSPFIGLHAANEVQNKTTCVWRGEPWVAYCCY